MSNEPTRISQLPGRPPADSRRPKMMAALALAEHLTACGELPRHLRIECAPGASEATVVAYAHENIGLLHAWQRRFGGELHHDIHDHNGQRNVKSTLTGRVYDAPFEMWTLRHLAPQPSAEELALCGAWMAEHGDPADWAPETHIAYVDTLAEWLTGGAR